MAAMRRNALSSAPIAIAIAIAALVAACGPPAPPKTVSMRVAAVATPPNASVTVDDTFVGTLDVVAARGVALPIGVHHVTVQASGYLPWDKTVEAKDGDRLVRIDVKLVPIPD